ncbi:LOW QUALITY PROTEIN: RRP12-like protein [Frieseomelitta varia]|uniref:LOW QUALITY PROTEIN: RRP12-like protein n=1 Tax=Frieseomelitta varia TaxID=561572 RepID=UPI001CB6A339|nr:LOW QUALITY PROTEIN: RRP12-like protein [Frieseomelitta varia]
MGKSGVRLNSRKKAKRWPKGQSASSNPQTVKHREQASRMFFKDPTATEKPGITKEDLQKHDAIQGVKSPAETSENDNNSWETCTEDTANTFATKYSNCSNVSFSRFLNHFQSNSLLHKEMLAVLSAVTEIIKQNGGNETSTEYFAAMMSTLEAIESNMSIAATLSLLGMGLKTVPKNVLNIQFGAASKIFLDILIKYVSSEEYLILRHCIHCLSVLLRAQEAAAWCDSSTMQILDVILSFIIHHKPKLRKSAQHGIIAILNGSDIMKSENPPPYHPATPYIAKFCIGLLQPNSESNGITNVLHILTLLKDIFHHLPKVHVKTISESLLKLMTMKNVLITSCCLQTFHGLFVSRPSEAILPAQRNGQMISALYVYQPPATDVQPTLAWLIVMQEAHLNIAHNSLNLCAVLLPRMFETCIKYWLSDKSEIISGTSHTIKILLQECVGKLCETEQTIKTYKDAIGQITLIMREALHYRYLEAWYYIFHLIALLFEIIGKTKNPQLIEIIKSLAVLRDSYNFTSKNDAEHAIGAAIKVLGPETILNIIPLKTSNNTINLKRSWLLPLLKNCVLGGSLTFFMQTLLPIATLCEKKSLEPVGGKTYEFLVCQIWAILPSICNNATDVKDNFKNIARLLGTKFSDKSLRMSILHALRRLVTRAVENNKEEDIRELARFAKNYLPLFLSLYTTKPNGTDEEGQRSSTYNTIKIYLTIANKELVHELFDRALSRLTEPDVDDFLNESIHDIIRLLIEHTDIDKIKEYYDISVSCLKENSKLKEQKKIYRFLEEICGSEKETCKAFVAQYRREIQKLLISSATEVAKPSRGSRLRCLIHLVKIHPQLEKTKFLQAIVPEAVIYLKDLNAHCRKSAYELLNTIAEKFLEHPTHLKNYINMLMVGLSGGEQSIQKYCIASLLALSSITYYYNGSLGMDTVKEILEHACVFVTSSTREITEAALAYIKVYITVMSYHIVAPNLKILIDALCAMNNDCQRHFRQKVRDILVKLTRKYGMETISSMIPASNVMLHKRLKNMNKIEMKKKNKRELKKLEKEENEDDIEFDAKRRPKSLEEILADSDDEFEENLENKKPTKKKRTSRKEAWIQENEEIIDLIDPAAARNISTTQPGATINSKTVAAKRKDREFKTTPDGRFIITLDNEKDDEPKPKRRKKSKLLLHSDSEDDYEDDDIQSVATSQEMSRKRKYSDNYDNLSVKSALTTKYEAGGSGIHRSLKKAKTERIPGAEYKASKAGGDVKKKGKPDPYAYVPLTRAALNKRKNKKNASKLHNIHKSQGAKKDANKIGHKKSKN